MTRKAKTPKRRPMIRVEVRKVAGGGWKVWCKGKVLAHTVTRAPAVSWGRFFARKVGTLRRPAQLYTVTSRPGTRRGAHRYRLEYTYPKAADRFPPRG